MNEYAVVTKNKEHQVAIPNEWRKILSDIVEAFKDGDFQLQRNIPRVCPVPEKLANCIAGNIEHYGAKLLSLPEQSWETSVCQWMDGYWDAWIDLFTIDEGCSDLALFVRISESAGTYLFEVSSVHVP